jgi:hypothetical protein
MSSESPDLSAEYACVTDLTKNGYNGQADQCIDSGSFKDDDEQPALTIATALRPGTIDDENAGFLRQDSILFVVAITDEDEEFLGANANSIYADIVAAKGGIVNNVVFLGIGGQQSCSNGAYGSALNATNLKATTKKFSDVGRGLFWDICDGDLEGAFSAAIEIVDDACFEFVAQ